MPDFERTLFVSDADLPVQVCIYAWISKCEELVIEYRFEDDRTSTRNFKRVAFVDREECMQMAEFYKVKVEELPSVIYEECGVGYESTPSHADIVFQETLNFILDSGVRYKLKETV